MQKLAPLILLTALLPGCMSIQLLRLTTGDQRFMELSGMGARLRTEGALLEGHGGELWLRSSQSSPHRLIVLKDPRSSPSLPLATDETLDVVLVPAEPVSENLPLALAVASGPEGARVFSFERATQAWREEPVMLSLGQRSPYRWVGYLLIPLVGLLDVVSFPLQAALLGVYMLAR